VLCSWGTQGGENTLQSARFESGLDNSPMYDGDDNGLGPVTFDNITTHVRRGVCVAACPQCRCRRDDGVERLRSRGCAVQHMQLYDVGMTGLFLSDTTALMQLATARNRTDVRCVCIVAVALAMAALCHIFSLTR
jgi:hypothetical protein